ncbi:MAG: DNA mismatch repair endonuclease MutL [bacterium]|nr:DNA mismatch repair endonuclease MutL [bacterium]
MGEACSRIHRLPESLVRKIAAGEVIERPASVLKELVENALDAGARRIHIDVAEGGRQKIRVVDDGYGMSRADAELSVERHATSKLSSPTDLFTLDTLGFRGEALASIGAVSRLSIETRVADDDEGTRIIIEGGVRREFGAVAHEVGTAVEVQSLFFNTPARRKFLRHTDTELRYLTQTVVQLSAAYPSVAFRLRHGDRDILDLLPGERRQRAAELLNADPEELLWVELSGGDTMRVEGFITPPGRCRRSRSKQFLIVRQRPIQSRPVGTAIYAGYGSLLPPGAHPQYVLWLDLDPRNLDVNVHPTKREVRFAHEAQVRQLVQDAVRTALRVPEARAFVDGDSALPIVRARDIFRVAEGPDRAFGEPETDLEQMNLSLLPSASPSGEVLDRSSGGEAMLLQARQSGIWQSHDKYLLLPIRDGILIVDQHAAHERVRFEEVQDMLAREGEASQQLLMPLTVDVSAVEMQAFQASEDMFRILGFGVREFGPTTLLVDSIPPELRNWGDGDIFYQILSDLIDELEARSEARDAMAASMACHTSIRAGERLDRREMTSLIERLLKAREPFACPHGRPILVKIPLAEFDRLFHRT